MEIHYKNNGHSFKAAVIHSITPKPIKNSAQAYH